MVKALACRGKCSYYYADVFAFFSGIRKIKALKSSFREVTENVIRCITRSTSFITTMICYEYIIFLAHEYLLFYELYSAISEKIISYIIPYIKKLSVSRQ